MFSTHEYLSSRTPSPGINREEFIGHLIEEYYTTTNVEAQEQVTANLANFAYDPINWEYLRKHNALQLFIEILDIPNESLNLHGTAGICNICLDKELQTVLLDKCNLDGLKKLLSNTENVNIILNILSIFYQLLQVDKSGGKENILTVDVLEKLHKLSNCSLKDARILNITTLLLTDFRQTADAINSANEAHCSQHASLE